MSSSVSINPIINAPTREEIRRKFETTLNQLKKKETDIKKDRAKVEAALKNLEREVYSIGRNEEKTTSKVMEIISDVSMTIGSIDKKDTSIGYPKVIESTEEWKFCDTEDNKVQRMVKMIRESSFKTRSEAESANRILSRLKNDGCLKEDVQEMYKKLFDEKKDVSKDESEKIREYELMNLFCNSERIVSFEEVKYDIDNLRKKCIKKAEEDYKAHIIIEACKAVGMDCEQVLKNGKTVAVSDDIKDCEIEITMFENEEILIETVGVANAGSDISIDEKRRMIKNAEKMCPKIEEMSSYIEKHYPGVSIRLEGMTTPNERNFRVNHKKINQTVVKTAKKNYMNME